MLQPAGVAYLLIDCSSSMKGLKLDQSRDGALAYAERALAARHNVGLISFATDASVTLTASSDSAALRAAARSLVAEGSTNLKDALKHAIDLLATESGTRNVVVVTDGKADEPQATLREGERAKRTGITIVTIGTDDADKEFLGKLASEPRLHFETTSAQLEQALVSAARLLPAAEHDRRQQ